jgi:hypothetical protein
LMETILGFHPFGVANAAQIGSRPICRSFEANSGPI